MIDRRRPEGIFINPFERGEIGPDLFRAACQMGLEGLVSKRRDSPYQAGRLKHWIKIKNRKHPAFAAQQAVAQWGPLAVHHSAHQRSPHRGEGREASAAEPSQVIQGAEENMPQGRKVPDDIRIGACADYILGKPTSEIEAKWQVSATTVSMWIKRTGSFKLRRTMGIRTYSHFPRFGVMIPDSNERI